MNRITRTILSLTLSISVSGLGRAQASDAGASNARAAAQDSGTIVISRAGSRLLAQAPATNFTGVARVEMLFGATASACASAGVEMITHLAFYAGWPSAVTAVGVAREVYRQR